MKIVSIGEITIDHYIKQNESFVGGISLNFAVQAKRCGAKNVSLVSCVGTDENGQWVLEKLSQEGIDTSHISILPGETATCAIQVDDHAERTYPAGGYLQNVLADFQLSDADRTFIQTHDILVSLFDYSQPFSFFHEVMIDLDFEGKRIADFGDWSDYHKDYTTITGYLENLDLAFISGTRDTVEALLPVSRYIDGLIVVTLGAEGSVALVKDGPVFHPVSPVPALLDTTGCGDAFQAAFTVTYYQTGHIEEALRSGAEQASTVIQHYGAIG